MFSYTFGRRNKLGLGNFWPASKAAAKHLVEVDFYAIYEWDSSIRSLSSRSHKQVFSSYDISSLNKHTKPSFYGEKILRLLKNSELKITLGNQCL